MSEFDYKSDEKSECEHVVGFFMLESCTCMLSV